MIINEFAEFVKFKIRRLLRLRTFLNFEVFFFISFIFIVYGAIVNNDYSIYSGIVIFTLTSIYQDFKSGAWRAQLRKEYGKLLPSEINKLKKEKVEENDRL